MNYHKLFLRVCLLSAGYSAMADVLPEGGFKDGFKDCWDVQQQCLTVPGINTYCIKSKNGKFCSVCIEDSASIKNIFSECEKTNVLNAECANIVNAQFNSLSSACVNTLELNANCMYVKDALLCDAQANCIAVAELTSCDIKANCVAAQSLVADSLYVKNDIECGTKHEAFLRRDECCAYELGEDIVFDCVVSDPECCVSADGTTYKVPKSGWYAITLGVGVDSIICGPVIAAMPALRLEVWVNGVPMLKNVAPFLNFGGPLQNHILAGTIHLNYCDEVHARVQLIYLDPICGVKKACGELLLEATGAEGCESLETFLGIQCTLLDCPAVCPPSCYEICCEPVCCAPVCCPPVCCDHVTVSCCLPTSQQCPAW